MDRRLFLIGLTAAAALIAGCQKETTAALPSPGICDKDAAEKLVGQDAISDAEAMQLTGATSVRQVKPGDPVTMDYRQERVTLETDPGTGKITSALCG